MSDENNSPSKGSSLWLDEHLEIIKTQILNAAKQAADSDHARSVEPRDVVQATLSYAPGHLVLGQESLRRSLVNIMASSVTGVTLVSAILAIVFGLIGLIILLFATWKGIAGAEQYASGVFDIAKIFAGAIVGSTAATVAVNSRS